MSARVYEVMQDTAARILGCGHCVVVDAVFSGEDKRVKIEGITKRQGRASRDYG